MCLYWSPMGKATTQKKSPLEYNRKRKKHLANGNKSCAKSLFWVWKHFDFICIGMRVEAEEGNKANDSSDSADYPISHISHPIILLFVPNYGFICNPTQAQPTQK